MHAASVLAEKVKAGNSRGQAEVIRRLFLPNAILLTDLEFKNTMGQAGSSGGAVV
jgi:hypothetical protein